MAKAKKPTKSKETPTQASSIPTIDPGKSAATAAAMVANKYAAPASGGSKPDSSAFTKLKEAAAKPHAQIGGMLDKILPSGQKRSNVPFSSGKQVGHNQTFGADIAEEYSRRTGG